MSGTDAREDSVYKAKLAEQAERYDGKVFSDFEAKTFLSSWNKILTARNPPIINLDAGRNPLQTAK